jgi:hypothetical protein
MVWRIGKVSECDKDLLKDTVKEERRRVKDIVRRVGSRLSGLTLVVGLIVFAFAIYMVLVPQDPALSPRLYIIFLASLGFIGVLNILCGLLLLLGED